MSYKTILQPGRNCWRIKHADRVAFLIDGDAYFTALYHTLTRAKQEITILSWDIYSELRLGALQGDKRTLTSLLKDRLNSNKQLRAHILNWDFSMFFAMSREWLPSYKLGWQTHPRLSFQLDNHHPIGASLSPKDGAAGRPAELCRWAGPDTRPLGYPGPQGKRCTPQEGGRWPGTPIS